jgi:hypothetical protein
MQLPSELVKICSADDGFTTGFLRRIAAKRCVHTMVVIVNPELVKFSLQFTGIPENDVVKKLAA